MSKKVIARISRWLHIYLSMISFVIVLFFSATGLTLNHADYFQSKSTTKELKGYMMGNQYNYSVGGKLRRGTTDTLRCTIDFEFTLRVQG
jgi:hypothetical protein